MEDCHSEEGDHGAGDQDDRRKDFKKCYNAILREKCEDSSSSSNESLRRECPELFNDYREKVMQHLEYLDGGLTQVDMIPGSSLTIQELDDDEIPLVGVVYDDGDTPISEKRDEDNTDQPGQTLSFHQDIGSEHVPVGPTSNEGDDDITDQLSKPVSYHQDIGSEHVPVGPTSDEGDDDITDQLSKPVSYHQDIGSEHFPDTPSSGEGVNDNTDQPRRMVSCHQDIGGEHVPETISIEDMPGNALSVEKEDYSKDVSEIYLNEDIPGYTSSVDEESSKNLLNNRAAQMTSNETTDYVGLPLANKPTPNEKSSEVVHPHNVSPLTYQEMGEHYYRRDTALKHEETDWHLPDNTHTTTYGNVGGWCVCSKLPTSSMSALMGCKMPDYTMLGSDGTVDGNLPLYPPLPVSTRHRNEELSGHMLDSMSRTRMMGSNLPYHDRLMNEKIGGHLSDYFPSINKEFKLAEIDHRTDQEALTDSTATSRELPLPAVRPSHPQASFLGFEQELSRCEAALREARAELREERKKQVVVDTFRKTLLEVDRMVSEELLRLNKDVERLQPLNRVAAEWARDSRQQFWFDRYKQEQQRADTTGTEVFKSYVRRVNDSEGCWSGEACHPPSS